MMEARRQERQRRESAKATAATSLPSSQDEEFNLRLVDLYGQQSCLWNTSLPEHEDVELKRGAWEKMAKELGSHLTAAFVRSRVHSMRHQLNVYKLQMIEYQMTPGIGKEPDKPYYVDRFAFLDTVPTPRGDDAGQGETAKSSKSSDSEVSVFRWSRPSVGVTRSAVPSIAGMVRERMEESRQLPVPLHMAFPRLQLNRMRRSGMRGRMSEPSSGSSSLEISEVPPTLQARPGESVSKTKLSADKMRTKQKQEQHREAESEDDELYNLHWEVRNQQRSLRNGQSPLAGSPAVEKDMF